MTIKTQTAKAKFDSALSALKAELGELTLDDTAKIARAKKDEWKAKFDSAYAAFKAELGELTLDDAAKKVEAIIDEGKAKIDAVFEGRFTTAEVDAFLLR